MQMMKAPTLKLRNPPIVEAVLDVDCDLPAEIELWDLEKPSRERFENQYPKFRIQFLHEHGIETKAGAQPKTWIRRAVQAIQHLHEDERQLVQVRTQGFSFNRLAPYSSLDDYIPEIERTWRLYVEVVSPVQIRAMRLRYINRILLPMKANNVDLDEFLKIGPRLPDEESLTLSGFLSQQAAIEKDTGHQVNLVLAAQAPENEALPIILDISVVSPVTAEPADWPKMRSTIESLRRLKNRIFMNTLTPKCIQLFQ